MDLAVGVLETLPPSSEVGLLGFDEEARIFLDRTREATAVRAGFDQLKATSESTALHDAVHAASLLLRQAPPSRKAIVLVTDGRDEGSSMSFEQGLQVAQEQGIPIFSVGTGRAAESGLRRIAMLTGGTYAALDEASGFEIASYVLDLPIPVATAEATTLPSRPGAQLFAPSGDGLPTVWLAVIILSLALGTASGAGALWLWSRRPRKVAGRTVHESLDRARAAPRASGDRPLAKTTVMPLRPIVKVIAGRDAGAEYTLKDDAAMTLGRASSNSIVIDEDGVSAEHCRIHPEAGQFVLYDVKSTNGTLVNDVQVSRHILQPGDVVGIGNARLQFPGR